MKYYKYFLKSANSLSEEIRCEEAGVRLIKFTDVDNGNIKYVVYMVDTDPVILNEKTYLKIKNVLEN